MNVSIGSYPSNRLQIVPADIRPLGLLRDHRYVTNSLVVECVAIRDDVATLCRVPAIHDLDHVSVVVYVVRRRVLAFFHRSEHDRVRRTALLGWHEQLGSFLPELFPVDVELLFAENRLGRTDLFPVDLFGLPPIIARTDTVLCGPRVLDGSFVVTLEKGEGTGEGGVELSLGIETAFDDFV